jgi:glycosyltransferase involved in cell wall biosynthesis
MRVLHIIDSGGLYGAEMMLLNLVSEQVEQGMEPIIASIGNPHQDEKPLEREAVRRGLRIEPFRMRSGPNLFGALRVMRFAREEQVDLLHAHGYKANILFGLLLKGARRIPMVSTVHGWTSTSGVSRMRFYEWLDAKSLQQIDRVVLVNSAMIGHARLLKTRRSFQVVNNGLASKIEHDLSALNEDIAEFFRKGFTLCAIGRLSTEKGFDILLDALKEAATDWPKLRLVIFGEGRLRPALERQVKELGLQKQVMLPGYLPNASRYLPLCKAFVLSSLSEGLPIVILEAMQAGVPIVATRVGGVPEVLADGAAGFLVEAGSRPALVSAIRQLREDGIDRKRQTATAARRVREHYSSGAMARQYLNVYSGLLSEMCRV